MGKTPHSSFARTQLDFFPMKTKSTDRNSKSGVHPDWHAYYWFACQYADRVEAVAYANIMDGAHALTVVDEVNFDLASFHDEQVSLAERLAVLDSIRQTTVVAAPHLLRARRERY